MRSRRSGGTSSSTDRGRRTGRSPATRPVRTEGAALSATRPVTLAAAAPGSVITGGPFATVIVNVAVTASFTPSSAVTVTG